MTVNESTWMRYIDRLRAINEKASKQMLDFMATHDYTTNEGLAELLRYGYGMSTRYGEAAAEVAAEMYDAIVQAEYQEAVAGGNTSQAYRLRRISPAEPAETATFDESAKAIRGTLKTGNREIVAGAVGRLVKMAAVDTTLKNALRDGAEFAWIPHGDTCAFCLMLASRGWQTASRRAIKNGHAEHIHANCDCTYAVRFDRRTEVEGYNNGARYLRMYDDADGENWKEKLNTMRRNIYAESKDAVEGLTPAAKSELLNSSKAELFNVDDWGTAL